MVSHGFHMVSPKDRGMLALPRFTRRYFTNELGDELDPRVDVRLPERAVPRRGGMGAGKRKGKDVEDRWQTPMDRCFFFFFVWLFHIELVVFPRVNTGK